MKKVFRFYQLIVLSVLLSISIISYAQSPKSKSQLNNSDGQYSADDIVFIFHKVTDSSFPALPSQENEVDLFFKKLDYWLASNADQLNAKILSNNLESFILYRPNIHNLSYEKSLEFKKFYNSLDVYIQRIVNSKSLIKDHIILPPSLYDELLSFFN